MLNGICIVDFCKVDKFKIFNLNLNFCCRYYIWILFMNKIIVLFFDIMNFIRYYIIGSCWIKNKKIYINEFGFLKIIFEYVFFLLLFWLLLVYWFMNYIVYYLVNLIFNCFMLYWGGWGFLFWNLVLCWWYKNFNLKNVWKIVLFKVF